ncbi:MAG: hypothetical protein DME65_07335 [Verrucomicrobia bacterium]|nr:MAG: hypothetical protein DME65_07335 [Verrucomicrobiota bacterium]
MAFWSQRLLEYGLTNLRCFVRPSGKLENLKKILSERSNAKSVELVSGDLLSREDCRKATQDVAVIIHLAAGMEKSFAGAFMNSALATRNLLDAFVEVGKPKRFVNVSSFAVYSNLSLKRNSLLDETCPLETASQERFDAYGFGKLKQEEIIREYAKHYRLPCVTLRPGYVFGAGKQELNGRVGIKIFGPFIQVNVTPGIDGEVFNIVDDDLLTARQFLKSYKVAKRFRSVSVPYCVAYSACYAWEKYSNWSKGQLPPAFNRRRCAANWKSQRYSNEKLKTRLGWKPRVPMEQAMKTFLAQFGTNGRG